MSAQQKLVPMQRVQASVKIVIRKSDEIDGVSERRLQQSVDNKKADGSVSRSSFKSGGSRSPGPGYLGVIIQRSEEEILVPDSDSCSVRSEMVDPGQRAESLGQSLLRFTQNYSELIRLN